MPQCGICDFCVVAVMAGMYVCMYVCRELQRYL